MNDTARIDAYLGSEAKYHVLPVPTPLQRAAAVAMTRQHLAARPRAEEAAKLARLAIFHDLRETAEAFVALLQKPESTPGDVQRTAAILPALVWLGNDAQVAIARRHYIELLRRADLERDRRPLTSAAQALGPVAVGQLRTAAQQLLARRRGELESLSAGAKAAQEVKIDALEEFVEVELPRVEQAARICAEILGESDTAIAAPRLISLYLQEPPEATPLIAEWSAWKLVRLPEPEILAERFLSAAGRYEQTDPERQRALDLGRARALRAARYFGAALTEPDLLWLARQPDHGTDALALRPDWEYPPPHLHEHDEEGDVLPPKPDKAR